MGRITNVRLGIAMLLVAGLGTACSPDAITATRPLPSAPHASQAPPPVRGHGDPQQVMPIVMRNQPLTSNISISQTIDSAGGTMTIPAAGLTVTFAPGAVAQPTLITITALQGKNIAYRFGPHGMLFTAPVTVTQDMTGTSIETSYASSSIVHGGYLANDTADILGDGKGYGADTYDAMTDFWVDSTGVIHLHTSSFVIPHFSGYMLCGA